MRIAAIQCRAILDDAVAVADAIVQRVQWAATEAVDVIVFPEAFLLGHSYDSATIRLRARQVSDFALAELCRQMAAFPSTLVVGALDLIDSRLFNRAFVIECGRVIGHYAKVYPNEPCVSAGEDFPTFVRSGVRYGINICNDANHADAAEKIADQQARLILYPLNNMLPLETAERWRSKSLANLVNHARQTGCWVVHPM